MLAQRTLQAALTGWWGMVSRGVNTTKAWADASKRFVGGIRPRSQLEIRRLSSHFAGALRTPLPGIAACAVIGELLTDYCEFIASF